MNTVCFCRTFCRYNFSKAMRQLQQEKAKTNEVLKEADFAKPLEPTQERWEKDA